MIENQLKIGQVDISNIPIDIHSRDEIPQLLLGLQYLYSDRKLRNEIFDILQGIIPENIDTGNGRPGMELWKILVLGTLRLNCNWDYDKLHDIANNHSLFTPEVLDEINQVAVKTGHSIVRKNEDIPLKGRCDSFVVKTDVHYPTDINLLLDAIRKVVFLSGRLFGGLGITEWRQYRHIFRKIKKQFNFIRKLKRSTSKDETKKVKREQLIIDAHRQYVDLIESHVVRAREGIGILKVMDIGQAAHIMLIEHYICHAERQIDQIRRRVLDGETISHNEKVFSIG